MDRPAIDVHVHLHPPRLARAIEHHFADRHGWVAAHSFEPAAVAATLAEHGVERLGVFSYALHAASRGASAWIAGHPVPGASRNSRTHSTTVSGRSRCGACPAWSTSLTCTCGRRRANSSA